MDRRDFLKRVGVGAGALVVGRFTPACVASPGTWLAVGSPIAVNDEQTAFEATLRAHPDWTHYLARAFGGAGPYYYSTPEFGNAPMQAFVDGAPIAQDTLRTRVARGMIVSWEALPDGRLVLPQSVSFAEFSRLAPGQADAYARIIRRR